jgi:hypothetical protein
MNGAFHHKRIGKSAWAWGWQTGRLWTISIRYEPRDLWWGIYRDPKHQRIFICIVPCFPIVIAR